MGAPCVKYGPRAGIGFGHAGLSLSRSSTNAGKSQAKRKEIAGSYRSPATPAAESNGST